jgi:hypothetical protein
MNSDFKELLKLFNASDFDGVIGHVISKKDLIANKRSVGRPQDLLDVNNLVESEQQISGIPAESEPRKKRSTRRKRDPDSK